MSNTGWTPVEDTSAWQPVAEAPQQSNYDKLTAGYNPKVEEWAQSHPFIGPIVRFLDATGGAALKTPEAIAKGIADAAKMASRGGIPSGEPTDTEKALAESAEGWADPNIRKGALSVLPEALGQGVGSVAGAETVGAGAARVKSATVPDVPALLAKAKPTILQLANEGITKTALTKAADLLPDEATFPGASLPSAEDFYAARGAELDRIRKMNDIENRRVARESAKNAPAPVKPNPFAGMTSTTPAEVQTMPIRSLENTPAGSASGLPLASDLKGSPTPFPAKFVSKFEEPEVTAEEPYSQDLITRNQRLVRPNEMPTEADLKRAGDYTQIPALRLRALKKFGDRLAANELTRRGIND